VATLGLQEFFLMLTNRSMLIPWLTIVYTLVRMVRIMTTLSMTNITSYLIAAYLKKESMLPLEILNTTTLMQDVELTVAVSISTCITNLLMSSEMEKLEEVKNILLNFLMRTAWLNNKKVLGILNTI
jgi:hypothetical protein